MVSPDFSFRTASCAVNERHFQPRFERHIGRRPSGAARVRNCVRMTSDRHIPVLGQPALEFLKVRDGGIYIDGTFGAGGYTAAILAAADCRVVGIDRDQTAIAAGFDMVGAARGRLTLIEDQFSNLDTIARDCGVEQVDGVVLDVGVSSMQLDQAERGFSFRLDGPLDMRMAKDGPSAADVVATADETDLANIIYLLGEERHSRGVARAIVKARAEAPIETTAALARIVGSVVRSKPHEIHPATRTFQALRIFVNDELGELAGALAASERVLKPGGRLVVVSFHSLEDRIVKNYLISRGEVRGGSRHLPQVEQAAATFTTLTKRPVVAGDAENARNPRARSAKLRAAERNDAPPQAGDLSDLLPNLPSLDDVMRGR
ncbi:MAG: S-adenosyl-methyltransferase MraW [Sphingomonas bacterium]|nr:S-adenosyl-methyltransferase MraW [Sphingomonas bacterium]